MEITTKELMTVARDLVGRNDRAFPALREIRVADRNCVSVLRAGHPLTASFVERLCCRTYVSGSHGTSSRSSRRHRRRSHPRGMTSIFPHGGRDPAAPPHRQ